MNASFQNTSGDKFSSPEESINIVRIFNLMIQKWYWFIITVVIAIVLARGYIGHTLRVYRVSASIMINKNQNNASLNDQFLQGMGLSPGNQNIQNQIMLLTSRTVTERALSELPFETDFYYKTLRNRLPVYPNLPVIVTHMEGDPFPNNIEFEITYLGGNRFNIESDTKTRYKTNRQFSSGDLVRIGEGSFAINAGDSIWLSRNINRKFYLVRHDMKSLVRNYNKRLKVATAAKEGTTLKVSIEGTNRAKDVDFINKLTDIFITLSLDKKNLEAARRIQFIDDQLVGISDSLVLTENRLQQFRSRNRVMDVSSQGQAIIKESMELENQRARIAVETNYYKYLSDYLAQNVSGEAPIAPATMGITDPGLTRLVAELATLQGQLSSKSLGEMNPLQNQLLQRIKNTKSALLETLNGLKQANSMAVEENFAQIKRVNFQAAELPGTERQLLGIQRKFKLNDELYTFLLERRAEQQMQKASNVPDNEVIDYANEDDGAVVSPKNSKVYLLAWFMGMAFPFLFIIIVDLLSKTVNEEEISRMTDLPVAGKILQNPYKTNLVVSEYPESLIAEAFRLLRSRMQFFTKDNKSPLILVTSSNAGEGKTFTSMNLGLAYSLMGKKTVLVGFDLRKPKIFEDFQLSNNKGVSTYLIGKDSLDEVIVKTGYENFYIIPSGPIPPNPSELTSLERTNTLFKSLKEKFDYIIVDSSPIGLVSDTYFLASMADSILLVVRDKMTLKAAFEQLLSDLRSNEIKGLSLVINGIEVKNKGYGYTYYSYGKGPKAENEKENHRGLPFTSKPSKKGEKETVNGAGWKSKLK
jgi:tyrosine-protein kinase Etk/Wzc